MKTENSKEDKGLSVQEIQEMIVGSPDKLKLLNIFQLLLDENRVLKNKLEKLEKPNGET